MLTNAGTRISNLTLLLVFPFHSFWLFHSPLFLSLLNHLLEWNQESPHSSCQEISIELTPQEGSACVTKLRLLFVISRILFQLHNLGSL